MRWGEADGTQPPQDGGAQLDAIRGEREEQRREERRRRSEETRRDEWRRYCVVKIDCELGWDEMDELRGCLVAWLFTRRTLARGIHRVYSIHVLQYLQSTSYGYIPWDTTGIWEYL